MVMASGAMVDVSWAELCVCVYEGVCVSVCVYEGVCVWVCMWRKRGEVKKALICKVYSLWNWDAMHTVGSYLASENWL